MTIFWLIIDRLIGAGLVWYVLHLMGQTHNAVICMGAIILGALTSFLRRDTDLPIIRTLMWLAYVGVSVLFFWIMYHDVYVAGNPTGFKNLLVYLLIAYKVIQSFELPETKDLFFSTALSLILAVLYFYWNFS
ncbi:MAG: hypothetical protein M1269_09205 [Chloroflexi bacterium]|nr:hypothetical protein [Chloroflexota bacterium]